MSTPRIYVDQPLGPGADVTLEGDAARHLGRVLRCRPGDALLLFDGSGDEYRAAIREIGKTTVTAAVGEPCARSAESPLGLRLVQGVSRGDRMDTVVQKATELGVSRITPLLSEFSVVRLDAARARKRQRHWERVSISACEQCGRNRLVQIDEPLDLDRLLAGPDDGGLRLLLDPGAGGLPDARDVPQLTLLIGPEGGFSPGERERIVVAGYRPVSLGPRVLRTETAAIAAVTLVQARWGDLG